MQSAQMIWAGAGKSAEAMHKAVQGAVILMPTRSMARALSVNEAQLGRSVGFMRWGMTGGATSASGALVGIPMMIGTLFGTELESERKLELEDLMVSSTDEDFPGHFVEYCIKFLDACTQAREELSQQLLSNEEKDRILQEMWSEAVIEEAMRWRERRDQKKIENDANAILEQALKSRLENLD